MSEDLIYKLLTNPCVLITIIIVVSSVACMVSRSFKAVGNAIGGKKKGKKDANCNCNIGNN